VDDDPVVRTMARATLEKNGFGVTEVGDGASALERLAGDRDFALMVLDLKMPGIHGLEMIQRVRGAVRTAGLPIIVVTGSEDAATEVGAMEAGADDYIRKPLDPPRFLARVKGALRRATG
jgi:DNA-binding response OmpR family regulator